MTGSPSITLIGDGTSDRALLPILSWLWEQHFPAHLPEFQFADLTRLPTIGSTLKDRLPHALQLYPCDVLFVHRDAEKEDPERRYEEIRSAIGDLPVEMAPEFVSIVPVRMSEAWMLFDVRAIRRAAGNPNGVMEIALPSAKKVETLPDPKAVLHEILRNGSGLPPRRRGSFNAAKAALLVSGFSSDFAPLRKLPSFQRLEKEVRSLDLR